MNLTRPNLPLADPDASVREFALTDADFHALAALIRRLSGIVLGDSKRDLVCGRLGKRLRTLGLADFAEYREWLDGPGGESEQQILVNAITTNLTSFFREEHHFDHLIKTVIPAIASRGTRLRIWSAGCSSGEEPYSIAMALHQALPDLNRWDARILATDIDTNMVETGHAGRYEAVRTETIPPGLLRACFTPDGPGHFEASPNLRRLIQFNQLNLLDPWPLRGPFDAIFCRNVVIYFDKDTQRRLFDRFAEILAPGGTLFIGHSESLFRVSERFLHQGRTIYRKIR